MSTKHPAPVDMAIAKHGTGRNSVTLTAYAAGIEKERARVRADMLDRAEALSTHTVPQKAIPEPPVHPSPAEMARRVRIEDPAAYGHLVTIGAYLEGVGAERARLRAFLIEMAEERREQAVALNDPAPRGVSEEMEAAELRGEARALRELAEGLR